MYNRKSSSADLQLGCLRLGRALLGRRLLRLRSLLLRELLGLGVLLRQLLRVIGVRRDDGALASHAGAGRRLVRLLLRRLRDRALRPSRAGPLALLRVGLGRRLLVLRVWLALGVARLPLGGLRVRELGIVLVGLRGAAGRGRRPTAEGDEAALRCGVVRGGRAWLERRSSERGWRGPARRGRRSWFGKSGCGCGPFMLFGKCRLRVKIVLPATWTPTASNAALGRLGCNRVPRSERKP